VSGEARKSGKAQLALALARGVPIAKWARASGVPVPTAFRWAREPEVRKVVEDHRRRTIDEAVGEMSKHFGEAAAIIWHTAKEGDSGSLRFRAARAIFTDMITVSKYSGLESRMAALEQGDAQRAAGGAGTNPSKPAAAKSGVGANPPAVPLTAPGGAGAG
jgi:hypothetical protein